MIAARFLLLLLVQAADAGWREEEVGEGVVWKSRPGVGVLEADLATARVAFVAAEGLEKTSAVAGRTKAVAAVNGGYFTREGKPLGILKIGGETLSTATGGRGAVGITEKGDFLWKRLEAGSDWPEAREAMGGVPLLVEDGKIPDMTQEKAAHLVARHPRTAIGMTKEKKLLLVVVDGRTREAAGMSCEELAKFMLSLGCDWALNLDGGGSSALWVRGKPGGGIVNRPSDAGGERAVANAVVILAKDVLVSDPAETPWAPRIEFAGEYELFARWGTTGRTGCRVTVGRQPYELDLAVEAGLWRSLGRFALQAGDGVELRAPAAAAFKAVQRN